MIERAHHDDYRVDPSEAPIGEHLRSDTLDLGRTMGSDTLYIGRTMGSDTLYLGRTMVSEVPYIIGIGHWRRSVWYPFTLEACIREHVARLGAEPVDEESIGTSSICGHVDEEIGPNTNGLELSLLPFINTCLVGWGSAILMVNLA